MERQIEGDVDPDNDEGESIDPRDIGNLDQRKIEVLRMAEVGPGETGHEKRPEIFERDPEEGGQDEHSKTEVLLDQVNEEREGSEEKAQVEDQEKQDEDARNEGNVSVSVDSHDDPVEDAQKGDEACKAPDEETGEEAFPSHGVEEGNKGKPCQEFKINVWKGKNQKDPGEEAEEEIPFFHGGTHPSVLPCLRSISGKKMKKMMRLSPS